MGRLALKLRFFLVFSSSVIILLSCRLDDNSVKGTFSGPSSENPSPDVPAPEAPVQLLPLNLEKVYPLNSEWNEYLDDDGIDLYSATDTTCSVAIGASAGYESCIHGGERRKVSVTGHTNCSGLTARDSLGAFNWKCIDSSGQAVFYSTGFNNNKGLGDLISDSAQWRTNSLIVAENGTDKFKTPDEVWYQNNIVAVPPNQTGSQITLTNGGDTYGRIYVVNQNLEADGYLITESKTSFVVLPSYTFSFRGSGASNSMLTLQGPIGQLWVEGSFNGAGSGTPAFFGISPAIDVTERSVFRNILISKITDFGMRIASRGNFYKNISFVENGNICLETTAGSYRDRFDQITLVNNAAGGGTSYLIQLNTQYAIFSNLTSHNNNSGSIQIYRDSVSTNTLSINDKGYFRSNNIQNTISHLTTLNSYGFMFAFSHKTVGSQILAANSSFSGLKMDFNDDLHIHNVASVGSQSSDLNDAFGDNNYFTGFVLTNTCGGSGGTNRPFDGSCNPTNLSTASFNTGYTINSSFVGKVTTDDSVNQSDTLGVRLFGEILDWLNFENPFRGWGNDGSSFPNADNRSYCNAGNCRVWDTRLLSTDSNFLNKSYDGVNPNTAFVSGSPCPAAVDGNQVLEDSQVWPYSKWVNGVENLTQAGNGDGTCEPGESCKNRYLVNATEILYDEIGDDDGLCESGEACIYSPNIGFYQGEGDYLSGGTCVFQDGSVSGVTMYAYPNNGV